MNGIQNRAIVAGRWPWYGAILAGCYGIMFVKLFLRGLTSDFLGMWAAGHLARIGDAASAYDLRALFVVEHQIVGTQAGYYAFPYPPMVLFAAIPLGELPYLSAFLVWMAVTSAAYLAVLYKILPYRATVVLAIASPAAFLNFSVGQNGFLSAALLGGSLVFLETQPVLAGIFLGLLTFKPQFGLLFPLVLLLTRKWRVVASAAVTVLVLTGTSYFVFGQAAFDGFASSLLAVNHAVLEQGEVGWRKIQTAYGAIRWAGGSSELAWCGQAVVALAAGIGVCFVWLRRSIPYPVKAAALAIGTMAVTPYLFVYDLVALAVPVAFLAQEALSTAALRRETMLWALLATVLLFIAASIAPIGPVMLGVLAAVVIARVKPFLTAPSFPL